MEFNKFRIPVCICICLSFLSAIAQERVDTNFHLYLLIGQSNMAGRGTPDAESKQVNPQILMLDSLNQWVPATDPVHYDKPKAVGVGPALGFAKEMVSNNHNIRIGLIPCAWGGSPIRVWEPGAAYFKAHPYDDAIQRTRLAMQKGVLKGILWHQGESDSDSAHAAKYMEKLKSLINRLRTDLGQQALPFVAGEIGYFNKVNYINSVINQLPKEVSSTGVASAKGLTDRGDSLHFNTPSARELGKRYALAMKSLQANTNLAQKSAKNNNSPIVLLCFDDAEISHYTIVAPLLKKYGFNATFMVCEMPWKTPGDSVYYMKWPQIAELYKMGFEIGSHTGHHKNMTKLTAEEKQQEVLYIENKCKEYGIPKPISFAYPGNRDDSLSQEFLKEMGYQFARTGGSKYFDPKRDSKLAIPSYTMGATEKLQERTWAAFENLQPGQILAFTIHGVPDIAHPDYTTSEVVFTQYLQYMKEHHFKVIAMRDLEKYVPVN